MTTMRWVVWGGLFVAVVGLFWLGRLSWPFGETKAEKPKGSLSGQGLEHLKGLDPAKEAWSKKTADYWKSVLSPAQVAVCRNAGTERPFTGKHLHNKEEGVFVCSSCGYTLFHSKTKFDSGTGWPSFYDMYEKGRVASKTDSSHGMVRVEVLCGRCNAHLGHVFDDGPKPTGLRYCINSVCLEHRPLSYAKTDATAPPRKAK